MHSSENASESSLERKIFGVGMQRTGTASMTRALQMLGLESAHFPIELWEEDTPPVLYECDAFFDNPIPLLYRELDRRCPGSKFILTVRDEDSWLESCEFLFTEKRDDYRFDENEHIREMHHALYGQNYFSEAVFREAFRRHNRQVKDYFSDRPDDLLVIDIAQEDKWTPICSFLDVERPDESFPHSHPSGAVRRMLRSARKTLGGWYQKLRSVT